MASIPTGQLAQSDSPRGNVAVQLCTEIEKSRNSFIHETLVSGELFGIGKV